MRRLSTRTNVQCQQAGKSCIRYSRFSKTGQLRGYTVSLNDVLNVELYNDNRKMFNQAWEETLLAFSNALDKSVLASKKVYTHEERFNIVSV